MITCTNRPPYTLPLKQVHYGIREMSACLKVPKINNVPRLLTERAQESINKAQFRSMQVPK